MIGTMRMVSYKQWLFANMPERIFISYRRDDTSAEAALIATALRADFGDDVVFMDTSSVGYGTKWPDRIRGALTAADFVFAVIGPDWLRAGSNEWGQRRIDDPADWVRQELASALIDAHKTLIPILVRDARIPPALVLPAEVADLTTRQAIELRRDYWNHDIKLLLAQVEPQTQPKAGSRDQQSPYPRNVPIGPDAFDDAKIETILATELTNWTRIISPLPEDSTKIRVELYRECRFCSFQAAIDFMYQMAPGCDIGNHHPRWENVWRSVRVFLTTWDIGHKINDRDVQLARYFDRAYLEFAGAAKANNQRMQGSGGSQRISKSKPPPTAP